MAFPGVPANPKPHKLCLRCARVNLLKSQTGRSPFHHANASSSAFVIRLSETG